MLQDYLHWHFASLRELKIVWEDCFYLGNSTRKCVNLENLARNGLIVTNSFGLSTLIKNFPQIISFTYRRITRFRCLRFLILWHILLSRRIYDWSQRLCFFLCYIVETENLLWIKLETLDWFEITRYFYFSEYSWSFWSCSGKFCKVLVSFQLESFSMFAWWKWIFVKYRSNELILSKI